MLNITLDDFISLFTGTKTIVTADNVGSAQCVDLLEQYCKALGTPRFTGNAEDIYDQAGTDFIQIPNGPLNFPNKGDIVVFSNLYNGTFGHVGISTGIGDFNTFEMFSQNDPLNSDCHKKTYAYANGAGQIIVKGWLRPKNPLLNNTSNEVSSAPIETLPVLLKPINIPPNQANLLKKILDFFIFGSN